MINAIHHEGRSYPLDHLAPNIAYRYRMGHQNLTILSDRLSYIAQALENTLQISTELTESLKSVYAQGRRIVVFSEEGQAPYEKTIKQLLKELTSTKTKLTQFKTTAQKGQNVAQKVLKREVAMLPNDANFSNDEHDANSLELVIKTHELIEKGQHKAKIHRPKIETTITFINRMRELFDQEPIDNIVL